MKLDAFIMHFTILQNIDKASNLSEPINFCGDAWAWICTYAVNNFSNLIEIWL